MELLSFKFVYAARTCFYWVFDCFECVFEGVFGVVVVIVFEDYLVASVTKVPYCEGVVEALGFCQCVFDDANAV